MFLITADGGSGVEIGVAFVVSAGADMPMSCAEKSALLTVFQGARCKVDVFVSL